MIDSGIFSAVKKNDYSGKWRVSGFLSSGGHFWGGFLGGFGSKIGSFFGDFLQFFRFFLGRSVEENSQCGTAGG